MCSTSHMPVGLDVRMTYLLAAQAARLERSSFLADLHGKSASKVRIIAGVEKPHYAATSCSKIGKTSV